MPILIHKTHALELHLSWSTQHRGKSSKKYPSPDPYRRTVAVTDRTLS